MQQVIEKVAEAIATRANLYRLGGPGAIKTIASEELQQLAPYLDVAEKAISYVRSTRGTPLDNSLVRFNELCAAVYKLPK